MNRKIALVLQARMDSQRLPGKSLLPLGTKDAKPLVFRVMEALNQVPAHARLLACPANCGALFKPLALEAGFELLIGPEEDVLERYCLAVRRFNIDTVIRATADNPFVFADAAAAIAAEALALGADYAGYAGLPLGAGVEAVCASALLRAEKEAASGYEREHVCPHLYGHPEKFLLHRPLAPLRWQGKNVRLTLDTEEDYERAQSLYAVLENAGSGRYNGAAILKAYRELHPEAAP
jgi:spore coat polysaccharide biosynthesis protein SpsF